MATEAAIAGIVQVMAAAAGPPVAAMAAPIAAVAAPIAAVAVAPAAGPVVEAAVLGEAPVMYGCKLDVWKGKALQTKGGLMKHHLRKNRSGTVVSIKASDAAKRRNNLGQFLYKADQKEPCPDE